MLRGILLCAALLVPSAVFADQISENEVYRLEKGICEDIGANLV